MFNVFFEKIIYTVNGNFGKVFKLCQSINNKAII